MPSNSQAIRRCESHASTNHGIVPRHVAVGEGLNDSAIARLIASGRWYRLGRRAYAVAGAPVTWRSRLAAAEASLERDFAFSHRTAAALYGLDPVRSGTIEVTTTRCIDLPDVRVHRIAGSLPRTVRIDGLPVTAGARTVGDLFAVVPRRCAELALEDALRKKITTFERLWTEYAATCRPGRTGCKAFRRALLRRDHRDGTLQSRMEAKLRAIIKRLPGDPAIPQFSVTTPGTAYRLDFAFPDVKLGIEAHSIKWHMGEAKWYSDMRRDRALKRAGWTLLYYGMDDLMRPTTVRNEIADVRDKLAVRLL